MQRLLHVTSIPLPKQNALYRLVQPSMSRCTNKPTIGIAHTWRSVETTTVPFSFTWQSASSFPFLFSSSIVLREANDKILRVDDALTADPNTADWFKVGELGLIRPDYWGTDVLNANCGRYAFKIPPCIPSGDYLIRAESKPVSF